MTSETSHVKHKVKQIKLSPRYKQLQNNSGRRKGEVKPELRDSAHGDPRGPTPQGKVPLIRVSESCNRVRLMPPLFVRTFHSFLLSLRPLTMDCSPSGSSVPGISQARILDWVATSFSKFAYIKIFGIIGQEIL